MESAAAQSLLAFLVEVGDAPELVFCAALAHLERAIVEAKEAPGRFRHHPAGAVRHLRERVSQGVKLARLAAQMQDAANERARGLDDVLHELAVEAARARRRAQTLPAQLARLEKQRRRREGLPTENFHLRGDYPAHGPAAD